MSITRAYRRVKRAWRLTHAPPEDVTYCFDLDGTLARTNGEDYANAEPRWPAIRRVNALHDAGHRIVIDTARGSGSGEDWTDQTRRQLDRWGVKYDELRVGVKVPADVYVDDRAVNVNEWMAEAT